MIIIASIIFPVVLALIVTEILDLVDKYYVVDNGEK